MTKDECIQIKHTSLSVGDTTSLSIVYAESGTPVPADKSLNIYISGGASGENGFLLIGGSIGTSFAGVTQPILYIAPLSIQGDSLVVPIAASLSESGGGGGVIAASAQQKDSLKISLKKNSTIRTSILGECITEDVTVENIPPCNDNTIFKCDQQYLGYNKRGCSDKLTYAGTSWAEMPKKGFINFIACNHGNGCFGIQIQQVTTNNYYSFCKDNVQNAGYTIVDRPIQAGLDMCDVIDDFTHQYNYLINGSSNQVPTRKYVSEDAKLRHEKAHIENFNKTLKRVINKRKETISRFCFPKDAGGDVTAERIIECFKCDDIEKELRAELRNEIIASDNDRSDEKYAQKIEAEALQEIIKEIKKEIKKAGIKCPKLKT